MNIKAIVEEKVNGIWKDYQDEPFCKIPPLSVSETLDNGIIFIGINPSLSEIERERLLGSKNASMEFYSLEQESNKNHRYFRKFSEIAQEIEMPWGHLDLLYLRERQQKEIDRIIASRKGLDFIYRQLMVTKEVMDKILAKNEPIIFVVNNTLARRFLGKEQHNGVNVWMGYEFEWKDDFGTYFLGKHPFFFSSMLTGQRALDIGSYERLIWHINFVKEKWVKSGDLPR